MSIITITTDFGYKDFYVSSLKAKILGENGSFEVIDISHGIKAFNIKEGFFVLSNSFLNFPKGSVHLFLVNEGGIANDQDIYLFELDEHFFVCTGMALITLFNKEPTSIVKVKIETSNSFTSLSLHSKLACQIASGVKMDTLGEKFNYEKPSFSSGLMISNDSIIGAILYIDEYGNAITNIKESDFEGNRKARKFEISFSRERVNNIALKYNEVENGDSVCIFNESNYLEIALSFGNASRTMGLKVEDKVKVTFL